ncbi:TioE family transcriptional regulator [Kibdelosporangium phytohabitans]|uniref:MerR family transcriptional regulator n=1 Tax=Kibdelosporangium phytohabitans TaxID=860235 RepID=A0A0N7F2L5_9PSEU|nr:TioE family transcriptional regulator [Kibdelosporangium phytohabitans]ALG06167.1 MerR family transcriptional regulator [Kibdelosporangium phytohabitans]MBE1465738.1 DNA-binding transcriptional MerR regulator [Kibdelosporangium phytohabitans]
MSRPIDLARQYGLSTQAVRNYEEAGILPPADRTPSGYRTYTPLHAKALGTFLALIPAHGYQAATAIMRAVNGGEVDRALALVDDSHDQLRKDRQTLVAVRNALEDLTPPDESDAETIGALAHQLRVRPATLRKWEQAGLVRPGRDPKTGYRVYSAADVRDAELTHQLRRGGYLLNQIAGVLDQVRAAGGVEPLQAVLDDWRDQHIRRGRAMLAAAAELGAYLGHASFNF